MVSNQRARRLLKNFRPDKAKQPKYRDPAFVALFLHKCEVKMFDDPRAGVETAQVGLELAERVGKPEKNDLVVRALAILASAHRKLANFMTADAAYERAFKLVRAGGVGPLEQAHLMNRAAILRINQSRLPDALTFADSAVSIFQSHNSPFLGEALVNRGQVYVHMGRIDCGISDLGEVLQSTNPRTARRVYYSALHNLAYALTRAGTLHAGNALAYIRQARREIRGHERSIPRAKLSWIEGLVYLSLHMTARAQPLLEGAYHALVDLEAYYDAALAAVDLVDIYCLEGNADKAANLLCDAAAKLRKNDTAVHTLHELSNSCRCHKVTDDIPKARGVIEKLVFNQREAQSARF